MPYRDREEGLRRLRDRYRADPEKYRSRQRGYYWKHAETRRVRLNEYDPKNRESVRVYQLSNPEKREAQRLAQSITLRPFCDICGSPAKERHHPDYSKPLDVMHLCKLCHEAQHHSPYKEKRHE